MLALSLLSRLAPQFACAFALVASVGRRDRRPLFFILNISNFSSIIPSHPGGVNYRAKLLAIMTASGRLLQHKNYP